MATVESTELGLCSDGREGWYKVVFTDASDLTIMENGAGLTLTGDQAGSKTASMICIPRVETRNSKAVVSGYFKIDEGDWFEWGEIITATASAGGLFGSETTATESAAFTGASITNRSAVGSDGEPLPNLRRTRFKRGAVPSGFTTSPALTFDADQESGSDGATISITDQVSSTTTEFTNSDGGGNGFTFRPNRYGTGRNAIELALNEGIENSNAVDVSNGVTYHFVLESDSDVDTTDRFGQFYDGGNGIVLVGNRRMQVRVSGGAASTPSRGDTNYAVVKNAMVLYTLVVYANGDRVLYVNGRPYCSEAGTAPTGTVTNKKWIYRHAGAGEIFLRRLDIIEDALTESEVYADHDYYANVIYADDEDLQGSLACFVSENGSPSGTGRYNDPVDSITAATIRSGNGAWFSGSLSDLHDVCLLVLAGETAEVGEITAAGRGSNEDPTYPTHIGCYGTPSSSTPIPILDLVDPDSGGGDLTLFTPGSSNNADEFAVISVEFASNNRNFRDGTATASDNLAPGVSIFEPSTASKGIRAINVTISDLTTLISESAGSLTAQDWSHANFEAWRIAPRNTYHIGSTETSSGTNAAIFIFLLNHEQVFIKDVVGYEVGWDAEVIASTNAYNLWGGASFNGTATNQAALDHGYGRFGYLSSTYGAVRVANFLSIRDSSHDIQFREGGMLENFIRWESAGPTYWCDQDSYARNLISDGDREIVGGNLIGYRGQQFATSGTGGGAPRLVDFSNILINASGSANPQAAIAFSGDRTAPSANSPTGDANIRAQNITARGFDEAYRFNDNAALDGFLDRILADLSTADAPGQIVEFINTTSQSAFDITNCGYDLDTATDSTAWDYNGTDGTLATLRSSSGMSVTPVLDRTSTGFGYTATTVADYAENTLGFTKVDGAQTDAEELGAQWFEAFADAIRQGTPVSMYLPDGAIASIFSDWQVDSTNQTAIDAVDSGATWGVIAPPTVVNRTPADNATGVSEAQTISMQFSENMVAGSGTIELRQVSDDSVLDSINAADATINFGDRTQVTLTGLALTGVSGAVYVYIPPGAFLSQSSGISFAGYTTSTDWNFTVGAAGGERSRDRSRLR